MSTAAAPLETVAEHSHALAVLLVTAATVGYLTACAWWPFTACGHCEGGKRRSPSGRNWRPCNHCNATGSKVRLGRRLWTAMRDGRRPQ